MNLLEIQRLHNQNFINDYEYSKEENNQWKKLKKDNMAILTGKIGIFQIYSHRENNTYSFALYDSSRNKFIMFLYLNKNLDFPKNAWQIILVYLDPIYRGTNLSLKIYLWLILRKNIILVSDDTQSQAATLLWSKLAKYPNVSVYGLDTNTKKKKLIPLDSDEIEDFVDDSTDIERDTLLGDEKEIKRKIENIKTKLERRYPIFYTYKKMLKNDPEYIFLTNKLNKISANISALIQHTDNISSIKFVAIKK